MFNLSILRKGKHVLLSRFSTFSCDSLNYYHLNTLMKFMMNFVYQSLPEIPPELDKSKIYEEDCIRANILWNELEKAKDVNGKEKFGLVAKVAKLVFILPHSNADEERMFRIVQ